MHSVFPEYTDPSAANMMSKVWYSSIAAVLGKCGRSCTKTQHGDGSSLNFSYANGGNDIGYRRRERRSVRQ